ncbi:MAG: methionyl-tRNA formyltransferase [Methyloceanibacter sp.]
MRIIFMGTPDFAVPMLAALLAAGHDIAGVYSQPPRAAGRGLAPRQSPVHRFAEAAGLPVLTPTRLKSKEDQEQFRALDADAAVVVAYGLILPPTLLEGIRHGALNLHASLLPRWRGAAPIQRAIMAGDTETGVAVMRIEEGLDTGPVCLTQRVPIGADETAGELHDRLAALGATLMVKALGALPQGSLAWRPQSDKCVTYAAKIGPKETRIDWKLPAREVHNHIRGLSPHPGAWFEAEFKNSGSQGKRERVKALRSTLAEGSGPAGTLLDDRLTIACGEGAVRLIELQRAGKRPMAAEEFLRGMSLRAGAALS